MHRGSGARFSLILVLILLVGLTGPSQAQQNRDARVAAASALEASILKDLHVPGPRNMSPSRDWNSLSDLSENAIETSSPARRISLDEIRDLATAHPGVYAINNAGTNIDELHALGLTGEGSIVAVIDSGIRPNFKILEDSIIGGVDFVDDGAPGAPGDGPSDWRQASNDGHGTFSAGLIVGHAAFTVNRSFETALEQHLPEGLFNGRLPLIGTAPGAKIYVVRIFGNNASTGAPLPKVVEAMNHVIKLRDDFNHGRPGGLKIDVANMSFGISTLAAGRGVLDLLADDMLEAGIVPVVSAGDSGPSTLTTTSPASSLSAITVGATSRAANERIMWEVLLGKSKSYRPGIGADARPSALTQIAWFSSRGPNADGRLDPDIVASGFANIGQGYCPDQILDACFKKLSIGSGTSFSAPVVSGIAAVLTGVCVDPQDTFQERATRIRNAIIMSAESNQVAGYFDVFDAGAGVPDAGKARELLCDSVNPVPNTLPVPTPPSLEVKTNVQSPGFLVKGPGSYGESMTLQPGERGEILYEVPFLTDKVIVTVSDVEMGGQNVLFGDRLFLYAHSAKTGRAVGDYRVNPIPTFSHGGGGAFEITNPDTGLMRITLNPDNLNAGNVDVTVSVNSIPGSLSAVTISDSIGHGQTKTYPDPALPDPAHVAALRVDGTTRRLDFVLSWFKDWAHYPTADIDLIVCAPSIPISDCRSLGNKKGATLASPERVSIENPASGDWKVLIVGFNIPPGEGASDDFELRVTKVPH